ncbi:MAG TPA: type II toxin-antitoxin system RelE/ParE family toxin [Methanofastidiosum sp.]|nr:type II toxin-antitoxin system RelE/ParE family toxin [Methanofastidiosum sp.]HOG74564.1 type II toxin-antitoxin system RelE/ParE family toxin [Methanofastidiosum sp.]HQQ49449.1 type II toxin-antitoxin system RelE/ParE family toxin [Methanofastidiosum sp.]
MYRSLFTKSFSSIYSRFNDNFKKIVDESIDTICEFPERGKPLRHYKNIRSKRLSNLRIIYTIKGDTVIFLVIGHRKTVYKELDKYF